MIRSVNYHSLLWETMVELGWVTLEVEPDGRAWMIFVGRTKP